MTTHYRAPFSNTHAVCGQRTRNFDNPYDCLKCLDASRRLNAARKQQQKGVPHAPPASAPQAADVNGGNNANSDNGVGAVTRAETCRAVGVGVVFGTASAPFPGTCVRKWPHQFAFRFEHCHYQLGACVITKYASPEMPAYT